MVKLCAGNISRDLQSCCLLFSVFLGQRWCDLRWDASSRLCRGKKHDAEFFPPCKCKLQSWKNAKHAVFLHSFGGFTLPRSCKLRVWCDCRRIELWTVKCKFLTLEGTQVCWVVQLCLYTAGVCCMLSCGSLGWYRYDFMCHILSRYLLCDFKISWDHKWQESIARQEWHPPSGCEVIPPGWQTLMPAQTRCSAASV